MKKSILCFYALFFALVFQLQVNLVLAQTVQPNFSINPFYQNIDIQKGQTSVPFSVKIKNNTTSPAVFRISVLDFGSLDESGGVAFLGASDNLKYGLASWIVLSNDTLVLKPSEEQTVTGTIENKESLSPGGHYGAVFFKIDDGDGSIDSGKDAVTFNPSLASLLFVRKIGGETYGLNLDSFNFAKNLFVLPDEMWLRFQNTGNVHVVPRGTVEIFDPLGRSVAKNIVNDGSGIILPESFRVFTDKFMPISPALIPGRYKVLINYRYDGQTDFTPVWTSFFFMPLDFIGLLVVLAGIIFVGRSRLKKRKNKAKEHVTTS